MYNFIVYVEVLDDAAAGAGVSPQCPPEPPARAAAEGLEPGQGLVPAARHAGAARHHGALLRRADQEPGAGRGHVELGHGLQWRAPLR